MVLCVEVNVVRSLGFYPRALLTPFTDNVELTGGDRRSYAAAARAQRTKGFEQVDVRFREAEQPDQEQPEATPPDGGSHRSKPAER